MTEPIWIQLRETWLVLTEAGIAQALISPAHAEGLVTALYTTREAAEAAAARDPKGQFVAQAVPDLWPVLRLLAEQGVAGLLLDEQLPLFWAAEQPDSPAPTLLAVPTGDDYLLLDESGPSARRWDEVVPWRNLAAFDRRSIRWLLGEALPFLGYGPDQPLYEYLPADVPQLVPDRGALLTEDPGLRETVALFSDAYAARWYWQANTGLRLAEDDPRLALHEDGVERLDDLAAELPPHVGLILNPARHRFYQGFFRQAGGQWFLATINGLWLVEPPFRCGRVARRVTPEPPPPASSNGDAPDA